MANVQTRFDIVAFLESLTDGDRRAIRDRFMEAMQRASQASLFGEEVHVPLPTKQKAKPAIAGLGVVVGERYQGLGFSAEG